MADTKKNSVKAEYSTDSSIEENKNNHNTEDKHKVDNKRIGIDNHSIDRVDSIDEPLQSVPINKI